MQKLGSSVNQLPNHEILT